MSGRMVPAAAVEGLIKAVRKAAREAVRSAMSSLSLEMMLEPGLKAWEMAYLKGPAGEPLECAPGEAEAEAEKALQAWRQCEARLGWCPAPSPGQVENAWSKLLRARDAASQRGMARVPESGMAALGAAVKWAHVDAAIERAEAEWAEIVRQAKEAMR